MSAVCNQTSLLLRCPQNPLITPEDVVPSRPDFRVEGVFNCGATTFRGETLLLCRVAESGYSPDPAVLRLPVIREEGGKTVFDVKELRKSEHPEFCYDDPRVVTREEKDGKKVVCLTSLSHLRLARSQDGVHFTVADKPTLMPNAGEERWGIEDPRITQIGETYYITYTASSPNGAIVPLIVTKDFENFQRKGTLFLPENKDVAIFPEKIQGEYVAFSRPVPGSIGTPDIWLSYSPDLLHWGRHRHFCGVSGEGWESGRIGAGAPPFRTEKGWVEIYHAADRENRYALGALLLDGDDPARILAKSREPLLYPQAGYEQDGFFGSVVFTCGCVFDGETVSIYYGAADDKICRGDISLKDLFTHLGV